MGSVSETLRGLISHTGLRSLITVAGIAGDEIADRLVTHRLAELVLQVAAAAAVLLLQFLFLVAKLRRGQAGEPDVFQESPLYAAAEFARIAREPLAVQPFQAAGVPVADTAGEVGKLPLLTIGLGQARSAVAASICAGVSGNRLRALPLPAAGRPTRSGTGENPADHPRPPAPAAARREAGPRDSPRVRAGSCPVRRPASGGPSASTILATIWGLWRPSQRGVNLAEPRGQAGERLAQSVDVGDQAVDVAFQPELRGDRLPPCPICPILRIPSEARPAPATSAGEPLRSEVVGAVQDPPQAPPGGPQPGKKLCSKALACWMANGTSAAGSFLPPGPGRLPGLVQGRLLAAEPPPGLGKLPGRLARGVQEVHPPDPRHGQDLLGIVYQQSGRGQRLPLFARHSAPPQAGLDRLEVFFRGLEHAGYEFQRPIDLGQPRRQSPQRVPGQVAVGRMSSTIAASTAIRSRCRHHVA